MYTSSRLVLSNSSCIPLSSDLSSWIGRAAATVFQQIHYWVKTGNNNIGKIHQGVRWIYNSYKAWQQNIKSYSESTIYRAIRKLEKLGIIKSAYLHDYKGNRTKWYTIDYEVFQKMTRWSRRNEEILYKDTKTTSKTVLNAETKIEEKILEESRTILQETILNQLDSPPPPIDPAIFAKIIHKRIKTHLGSASGVTKYLKTIAENLFLMGQKAMKNGDRFKPSIGFILSEKTLNHYINKTKYFNVWPTKQPLEEEQDMPRRKPPETLPPLTKEEAMERGQDEQKRNIIGALYDALGEGKYKTWFHVNGFIPHDIQDGKPIFEIQKRMARTEIESKYADILQKAFELA